MANIRNKTPEQVYEVQWARVMLARGYTQADVRKACGGKSHEWMKNVQNGYGWMAHVPPMDPVKAAELQGIPGGRKRGQGRGKGYRTPDQLKRGEGPELTSGRTRPLSGGHPTEDELRQMNYMWRQGFGFASVGRWFRVSQRYVEDALGGAYGWPKYVHLRNRFPGEQYYKEGPYIYRVDYGSEKPDGSYDVYYAPGVYDMEGNPVEGKQAPVQWN